MRSYAAGILLITACTSVGRVSDAPRPTTICSLVAQSGKFDGAYVRVHAYLSSDGIEHTTLIDRSCPTLGVAPLIPDELRADATVIALERAIFSGQAGTRQKEIRATFVGTFNVRRGAVPARILTVSQISELEVMTLDATPDVDVVPP